MHIESGLVTAARELITGFQHQSNSSGLTQEYKLLSATPRKQEWVFSKMPGKILNNAFTEASYIFIHHTSNGAKPSREWLSGVEIAREAILFIQGTGLDIFINTYHLSYDPNRLRENFCEIFNLNW